MRSDFYFLPKKYDLAQNIKVMVQSGVPCQLESKEKNLVYHNKVVLRALNDSLC